MEPLLAAFVLSLVGYIFGSVKVINEGTEGLVERFGQYRRTLRPGLNVVIPLVDTVLVESTREQILDIKPQSAITKNNVTVQVDAVVFWKILDIHKAYYSIENLEVGIENLVVTTMRSAIGEMELQDIFSNRDKINKKLLFGLDEATQTWGVKVLRVEVQEISFSETLREALELERAAKSKKQAAILETEGMVQSIELLANSLSPHPNHQEILKFLVAQRYVDANLKLGDSNNSKIIFMDPKALSESVSELIAGSDVEDLIDKKLDNGKL